MSDATRGICPREFGGKEAVLALRPPGNHSPERSLPGNLLPENRSKLMRYFAYILGFLLLIGGLAWGAIELGAPQLWVLIGSMILLGIGIISGASRTRFPRSPGDVTVVRENDVL